MHVLGGLELVSSTLFDFCRVVVVVALASHNRNDSGVVRPK